ncbi:hypothetical protein [Chryseobacterium hagamense]|uniref:Uncharacterized protein n=1 Tax=Chryseobacterium hagamense TaxID=395935 RepID=A0A511YP63_9FLAO|nr:hypothetical protein [Chryseobacterium hagamense]GEN76985.1 hypothetical protein CHA01nite_27250 [Chryseobacterium hagamense]
MELNDYLQSYKDYFWEWTTDEDVPDDTGYHENNLVSIPQVGAVAYRAYLIEVLKQFQMIGLPFFTPLVLALYATNEGYLDIKGIKEGIRKHPLATHEQVKHLIRPAFQFLETLKSLPAKYKKGKNRILLLQTVFSGAFRAVPPGQSEYIIKFYLRHPQQMGDSARKAELTVSRFSKDLNILATLNERFPSAATLIEAMKGFTDIPELEDEVAEEETTVETGADFIQELIEEPKTFQVGSLIKRIWSGLKIPMRHLSPGEQPIGGISDMTNKGELHRMLLSEFANEDDVFMNRVANNEALYIQREIPPEENIFERVILIDTSLKNWGTPKVLAFASAIAVIKHPKAHSACKVFALGQNIIPIALDKVDEVLENLNQVSPVLEVSHTLERFFEEEHKEKDLEVFFITHQENLANQNLQRVIHENRDRLKFLVTTSAEGELNFYKHHKGTRKHIQKIMLPLQELWANPPKRNREGNFQDNSIKTPVPENYPLLFPTPKDRIKTFLYEGDFYILSNRKQLLKTYLSDNYYNRNIYRNISTQKGCEVIAEKISVRPKGSFALAKDKAGDYILAQYQPDKKILSKLNLNTKEYNEMNLTGQYIPEDFNLIYFNRNFYLYRSDAVSIFKMNLEGEPAAEPIKNHDEIVKTGIKIDTELRRLNNTGIKILNNFNRIGISNAGELIIDKFALGLVSKNVYGLSRNYNRIQVLAIRSKNKFMFDDGSEVITDSRGMLTFISSNKNIPVFYMPSTHYGYIALATEKEFAGSEYYLPKNSKLKIRETDEMYREYMGAFIRHVLEYGT